MVALLANATEEIDKPRIAEIEPRKMDMEDHITSIEDPDTAHQVREFYEQITPSKKK